MDAYIGRRREAIPDDESADCAGAMGGNRGPYCPRERLISRSPVKMFIKASGDWIGKMKVALAESLLPVNAYAVDGRSERHARFVLGRRTLP